MSEVAEKLDALLAAFQNKGIDPTNNLRPGLSDDELEEFSSQFGCDFPEDVRALFRWRNGSIDVSADPDQLFVFRDQPFLSLSDAKQARDSIRMFLDAFTSAGLSAPFEAETLIPIAEFEGQYFAVATSPDNITAAHPNPVVSLGEDMCIYFYSVSSMLDTCLEWVRDPAYSVESPVPEDEMIAWEKYNPGVFNIEM